MHSENLKLSCN